MESVSIQCPHCSESFSLTEVLRAELEERFAERHNRDFERKEAELALQGRALELERERLLKDVARQSKEFEDRLTKERLRIEAATRGKFEAEFGVTVSDLTNQLMESNAKLQSSFDAELVLRSQLRAAQTKEQELELEIHRRVGEQRAQLVEEISKAFHDDYRLKTADKDRLVEQLRRQVEELSRKLDQGSEQSHGEVLEIDLETVLRELFPTDVVTAIPKGVRGGDLNQKVVTTAGTVVGSILWEAKRTKQWNDQWLKKAKEDQRQAGADLAVIVTSTLPKDVESFDLVDGIWISDQRSLSGLAAALRQLLINVNSAKKASSVQSERLQMIQTYLTGTQFRHRVEAIVESFHGLQVDLEKERRSMQKMWASREQQLGRVMNNTLGMYGDLQGIMGVGSLEIPSLEMEMPTLNRSACASLVVGAANLEPAV